MPVKCLTKFHVLLANFVFLNMYFLRKAEKFRINVEFFVWIRIYIFQKKKNTKKSNEKTTPKNSE